MTVMLRYIEVTLVDANIVEVGCLRHRSDLDQHCPIQNTFAKRSGNRAAPTCRLLEEGPDAALYIEALTDLVCGPAAARYGEGSRALKS